VSEITLLEAISQALRDEMRADPRVFLIGEDLGRYGAASRRLS
jgi:pyruvate/2-oxoglutarate/acetoin dehydrogenase E1 component